MGWADEDHWISHLPLIVEEAHDVVPNASKTRVERFRADLHEHVAHVLHQDQLSLVTRGLEIPIELNRLRFENFRVVDSLHQKDGRRVRNNEMRGARKSQIPMIVLAKDLLNAGGREP